MNPVVRARSLFFLGALAAALLATFPLRLALDGGGLARSGVAARDAKGSLWWGSLEDVRWGPVPLGDADAGIRPLQLLLGRAALAVQDRGGRDLSATLFATANGAGVSGADAFLPVGTLFAPLPVTAFELEDVTAAFGARGCSEASGLVRARVSGSVGGLVLPPALSGAPRCEGAALLLPLSSPAGAETLELRIAADGRYEAAILLRPSAPAAGAALAAAGLRRTSRGYLTVVRGSLAVRPGGGS